MAIDPGRLNVDLLIKQGNLTLTDLSILKNLQVIDDKMAESSGMLSRVIDTEATDIYNSTGAAFNLGSLGVSDCRFVYIESDQEVVVEYMSSTLFGITVGGGPPLVPNGFQLAGFNYMWVTPPSDDPTGQLVDTNIRKVGIAVIKGKDITSVTIKNMSGNQANVRIFACGYQA
jgi:hypothetical protein